MSLGLQLLHAAILAQDRGLLVTLPRDALLEEERRAFEIVSEHLRRYSAFPSFEVLARQGVQMLPAPDAPTYYRDRVLQRARHNLMAQCVVEMNQALQRQDPDSALDVLARVRAQISQFEPEPFVSPLSTSLLEVADLYNDVRTGAHRRGVTFGWDVLDEATGGADRGDLVTLAGRPGTGKSWLTFQMAWSAWRSGHSVMLCSMEMTPVQAARRILGRQAGINPDRIRRGQIATMTGPILESAMDDLSGGAPFWLMRGDFKRTTEDLDIAVQEHQPDAVYVDASYLMKSRAPVGRKARWEIQASVMEELKEVAQSRNVPIINSVQLNREGRNKSNLDLSSIAGTDAIGQLSSIALALYKPEEDRNNPLSSRRRKISVMKVRDAPDELEFTINFSFNPPDFSVIPDEELEAEDPAAMQERANDLWGG